MTSTFAHNEEVLIRHFEEYLATVSDPKRRIKVATEVLNWAYLSLRDEIALKRHKAYKQRKAAEEAIKQQLQLITKLSLGPGSLIKLKGTRDSGIREIIRVEGTKVFCHQLVFRSSLNWAKWSPFLDSYHRSGIKTTHDLSKITHASENGEWKNIRQEWLNTDHIG
jgi:hypothetical protein